MSELTSRVGRWAGFLKCFIQLLERECVMPRIREESCPLKGQGETFPVYAISLVFTVVG